MIGKGQNIESGSRLPVVTTPGHDSPPNTTDCTRGERHVRDDTGLDLYTWFRLCSEKQLVVDMCSRGRTQTNLNIEVGKSGDAVE